MFPRLLGSPILVFIAGLLGAGVVGALAYSGLGVTTGELARAGVLAFATAVMAALASVVQRRRHDQLSRSLSEAAEEAKFDPLTGLVNRSELYRALDESRVLADREQTVFGVLFLDLDRFKAINDSLGHDVGDELLRIVADRLRAATRSTDVVGRLGGDEFVVICRSLMTARSVEAVATQIIKRLGEPVALRGRQHTVSASIGVAISTPGEERSADDLVRDADAAMYKAKRDRCGYSVFDAAQRSQLTNRLDVERELRDALDGNQLLVHYQPVVDADVRRLYGLEALVRWEHPSRGLISPGFFLPVADEARLMSRIGELVLREACAQAAIWNHNADQQQAVRIGVNIAEQQLTGVDLPVLVDEILTWSGLPPEQLVLEITENVVMEHLDGLRVLRQLRELGVHLAIDDFGTGHSSLSYIKEFDMVSILKIDQSFVRDMLGGGAARAIVEAIVAMARALDLDVVAEGVERPEQLDILRSLGVDLMQGFLFEQPRSADRLSTADGGLGTVPWPAGVTAPPAAGRVHTHVAPLPSHRAPPGLTA
ncbi:MAG: EAL domain-containing protein [Actinomycetota bacterium]